MEDTKLAEVVRDLHEHLLFLKDENVDGIAIPGNIEKEVQRSVEYVPVEEEHTEMKDTMKIRDVEVSLRRLREKLGDCKRCKLHSHRTHIVFGEGSLQPEIFFIGEGPGHDEDIQGRPFVGRAGKLLDRIISAMGLSRSDVYIGNIVKCRPPGNRNPEPDEIAACSPVLVQQVDILQPKIICALGNVAATFLIGKKAPMTVLRGRFYDFRGICVRPTYHPAALLRNPKYRRPVWEDVQEIMRYLGKPIPTG